MKIPTGGRYSIGAAADVDADIEEIEKRWRTLSKDIDRLASTLQESKTLRAESLKKTNARAWEVWKEKKEVELELEKIKPDTEAEHAKNIKWLQGVRYQAQQERWKHSEALKAMTAEITNVGVQEEALQRMTICLETMRSLQGVLATRTDPSTLADGNDPQLSELRREATIMLEMAETYTASGGDVAFGAIIREQAQRALDRTHMLARLAQLRDLERTRGILGVYDTVAKMSFDMNAPPDTYRGTVYYDVAKTRPLARFDLDRTRNSLPFITHHMWDLIAASYQTPT